MNVRCINGERDVLTYLPNPKFQQLKGKYKQLERTRFCDKNEDQLSIHITLAAADYQRNRSAKPPVLGGNPDTDPGAECTIVWGQFNIRVQKLSKAIFLMVLKLECFRRQKWCLAFFDPNDHIWACSQD